jgi:hypothetical protein
MQRLKIAIVIIFPAMLMIVLLTGIANRSVSGANEFTVIGQAQAMTGTAASPLRSGIKYQGVAALNGVPLNGTRAVTFSFSPSSDCLSSFRSVVLQVTFVNGVFSAVVPVELGDFLGSALWLKVTMLDDQKPPVEVFFGCDEILPVPYAFTSLLALEALSLRPITSFLSIPMKGKYYIVPAHSVDFRVKRTEPVLLPHGATMLQFTSVGECYKAEFVRVNLATGNKQVLATHTQASGVLSNTTAPLPDPLVDNENYAYGIEAATDFVTPACGSFTDWGGSNYPLLPLHGITIQYTTTHP